jgi:hypothetical protein
MPEATTPGLDGGQAARPAGRLTFHSILFKDTEGSVKEENLEAPVFFVDLNLDQIIDAVTAGRQEYNLKPFFYTPLNDIDAVKYRHEIFRDLENENLFESIKSFAQDMHDMRRLLAMVEKLYFKYHKEGWFLQAVDIYCEAVNKLVYDLSAADLRSCGLSVFRRYVADYAQSPGFASLATDTKQLKADLSKVKYTLTIKGNGFTVRNYESENDYSVEVEETFEKFRQGAVKDYRAKLPAGGMNHVEAQALEFVAKLYPEIFSALLNFFTHHSGYQDETISVFDRQIQFYIAHLEYAAKFRRAGLTFCYPQISNQSKEVFDYEGFDLALAQKLINEKSPIVCNDFYLKDKERIFVVSGPNQGGKTTFARTFGQLHYLAALGCPVPGREARLFLFDNLFTHFERAEDINNLRGKLEDDLARIHSILSQATSNSVVIMNEIFTSTTLQDAVFLSEKVMQKVVELDLLCVWVSFIDELASFGERTVSMVSTIVPENPALRTFKIVRRPADGLAYAIAIAEKYKLTYHYLRERIK